MNECLRISVCLATYNGAKYIKQQIDSILSQLNDDDEIIVSDDYSTDSTIDIILGFQDERIKVFQNSFITGPVGNFQNAISKASGKYIFLSDQDDIWRTNKVAVILESFKKDQELTCVFSNADIIDGNGHNTNVLFFLRPPKINFINMVMKNRFLGCTMAFKRDLKILPFPAKLPMHDWYIGLTHILIGKVRYIDLPLIGYRRHGNNVTSGKHSNIKNMIKWRYRILSALIRKFCIKIVNTRHA